MRSPGTGFLTEHRPLGAHPAAPLAAGAEQRSVVWACLSCLVAEEHLGLLTCTLVPINESGSHSRTGLCVKKAVHFRINAQGAVAGSYSNCAFSCCFSGCQVGVQGPLSYFFPAATSANPISASCRIGEGGVLFCSHSE